MESPLTSVPAAFSFQRGASTTVVLKSIVAMRIAKSAMIMNIMR